MNAEFRLKFFESNDIFLFVSLTSGLPSLSDVRITQLTVRIALDDFHELIVFHLLSVTVLSENLVERLSDAVEQLFDDFDD
jgi:hypothetical protein